MMITTFESVVIIADDLTGANDAAVKFTNLGFSTITALNLEEVQKLLRKYDVVAIDTESRNIEEGSAYKTLKAVGERIRDSIKNTLVFKKIDSTLRGNISFEIRGLFDALKPDLVVFAPAFPKQGRTTINGIQLVEGVPVEQTYFGKDIRTPVKSSEVSSYFSDFKNKYSHVTLRELRSEKFQTKNGQSRILSFDAETDDDLRNIVHKVNSSHQSGRVIWVGSAGLAEHVAYNSILGKQNGKPLIMGVGSVNELTRSQVKFFANTFNVRIIQVRIKSIIEDYDLEHRRILDEVSKAIDLSCDIVITTSLDLEQIREGEVTALGLGLNMLEFGSLLADRFGKVISSAVKRFKWNAFCGLFLTGGDIAVSTMKHLGISALEIRGEIEPGIPILKYGNIDIVTKAGGFGQMDTLIRIASRLKKRK